MQDDEIKPSFTGRYILLTIISTIIITGITYSVDWLSKSKPIKKLAIYETPTLDLIKRSSQSNSQIEAIYYLAGNPKREIKSLFRKLITIKNVGNEGVENLSITFSIDAGDAHLISKPNIESSPKSILSSINLKKNESYSSETKHVWDVPLLNPNESLTFEYNIYSEKITSNVELTSIPRKKDWEVIHDYGTLIDESKVNSRSFLTGMVTLGTLLPILLIIFTLLMGPVYRREWERNPIVRQMYKTYAKYYLSHFPPPILRYFK